MTPGQSGTPAMSDVPDMSGTSALSVAEAAALLDVNERTVRRYIEKGKLPAQRVLSDRNVAELRIARDDLDNFQGRRFAIQNEPVDSADTLPAALSAQLTAAVIAELRGTREAIECLASVFEQSTAENRALRARIEALEAQVGHAGQPGHPTRPRSLVGQIAAYVARRLS